MVYDTQEIIERAHHGDMDYIKHALTLFTDFVAVLVRILVIMVSIESPYVLLIVHTVCHDLIPLSLTMSVYLAAQERG